MAYAESAGVAGGAMPVTQEYKLGNYTFKFHVTQTSVGQNVVASVYDETNEKQAIYSKSIPANYEVKGWNVSCDESTATVYVTVKIPGTPSLISGAPSKSKGEMYCSYTSNYGLRTCTRSDGDHPCLAGWATTSMWDLYPVLIDYTENVHNVEYNTDISQFEYNGIQFWMNHSYACNDISSTSGVYLGSFSTNDYELIGQYLVEKYYSFGSGATNKQFMVGRFFIDLKNAGGTDEPADEETGDEGGYDDDWEEPDDAYYDEKSTEPSTTLYLTVHGARSGRHNDPIKDASYSYVPAANDTEAFYGCGGAGGHGGGGGAGASTVIVKKFSTSKANSHEVTAIAQSHGYGSGGGAGASGGDGCILIYY